MSIKSNKQIANGGRYRFSNEFPKADTAGLFSGRNEISYILQGKAEEPLVQKITELFPDCNYKSEVIATSYFEPVLGYDPEATCVIRFRQRAPFDLRHDRFDLPEKWALSGPGSLEVKIRSKDKKSVVKLGTFLPANKRSNLYELIRLSKIKSHSRSGLVNFVEESNINQVATTNNEGKRHLHLITPEVILRISDFLTPQFTRLNLRRTFELTKPPIARITIETHPAYYAYPIEHRVFEEAPFRTRYYGWKAEEPNRTKIEIKSADASFGRVIEKKLFPILKNQRIPKDRLTNQPFPKMIINLSKKRRALIDEHPGREIEAKANIIKETDISSLMQRVRDELLGRKSSPYQLFLTDPEIKIRGEEELNRTIIGWQNDKGRWHEVVTVIRLTKSGSEEFGFSTILKWKGDPLTGHGPAMNRRQEYEYLNKNIDDKTLLRKLRSNLHKDLQVVGVTKKIKYRIFVQDHDGRNFCISLDECRSFASSQVLQQLEVEYVHTVVAGPRHKPTATTEKACSKCTNFFIAILDKLGVEAKRSSLRKIDFVGLNRKDGVKASSN